MFVVVAGLCASLAVALTAGQLLAVRGAVGVDLSPVIRRLRAQRPERRLDELARQAPERTWVGRLARELARERDDGWRAASLNDALDELAHALEPADHIPKAAVRLSALGGLLCAVLAYVRADPSATVGAGLGALVALGPGAVGAVGLGAAGALGAAWLGRSARREATARRKQVDELVELLLPGVLPERAPGHAGRGSASSRGSASARGAGATGRGGRSGRARRGGAAP